MPEPMGAVPLPEQHFDAAERGASQVYGWHDRRSYGGKSRKHEAQELR